MRVKKYLVKNMPEAMELIKLELGPNAVILHSEKVRKGGVFGLFARPKFEVVAAVDTDLQDFPQHNSHGDPSIQAMRDELKNLRVAISQVAARPQPVPNSVPRVASLESWYQRLIDQGVAQHLAHQTIQRVANELSRWTLDNQGVLNEHLHWYLGRQLPPPVQLNLNPAGPQVFFVVGPTGVGKTTTLAKLAAKFAHTPYKKNRVLMITTDTFRVAAIPQISAFGEILGVPVEVAYTPDDLLALIKSNADKDLILIDTPGRSQRAASEVAALSDYLAAVPEKIVHLAINAGTKYEDMHQIIEAFSAMPLDGLIFTKIDETSSLGAAYSVACERALPLSYLTNGQRVPEDIEVATADYVVDLLVGPVPDGIRSTRNGNSHQTMPGVRQEVTV
ncbi:MAG: flagellar biosynthesis protein FlhF [Chloroflexi bacterium]|nr:MAG: flagellar biosynthesis protein FlhF [Chloroflexota bacterium]